ncbi:MAG TPA: DUF445 domain-containing protein [Alphaproteobacteria bacterium]|nr:DUF445 domain-containing protein [Alphaproteobacteria bacterium]
METKIDANEPFRRNRRRGALEVTVDGLSEQEALQRRTLRRHRLFATGLLIVAALIFVLTLTVEVPGFWTLLVQAGAEAAMVGGLADWFAVTALFRRPLGLPIPHTALVPRNKDRIGVGLGSFVERNFLHPDLVVDRLRSLDVAALAGRWLARPESADLVAGRIVAAVPVVVNSIDDDEVRHFIRRALHEQLDAVDLAPFLSKVLAVLTENRQHQALFDQALKIARRLLLENEERIYEIVGEKSRWWVPRSVDRRLAEALVSGMVDLLGDLTDPDHEARRRFDQAVEQIVERLATSPEAAARVAAIKTEVLTNPAVEEYLGSVWELLKRLVLDDVAAADSQLHRAIARGTRSLGGALVDDQHMRKRVNRRIEKMVIGAVVPARAEIGAFIADVVRSWDARTVAERLELEVGRDLQYIRINGTLVGALVGCAIFLISHFVV